MTKKKYPPILVGRVKSGKYKGQLLRYYGQQFVELGAPTRTGKGVSVVIPNLVNYPESVVVNDIKLENFRLSAGFRKSCGQEVFVFAPDGYLENPKDDRDKNLLRSHRWNALTYVRRSHLYRVGDLLAISAVFYPLTGSSADFWNESAGKLFLGFALFLLDNETSYEVSFTQLLKLTTPDGGLVAWMKEQIEMERVSDECKAEFISFIQAPDDTRGSILANLISPLAIFRDPICAAATSGDDFDLREVRRKPMSIYIGLQPNNLAKFSKLLNLFWTQLINENTTVLPQDDPSLKYQCLMIMDEFTSMGRVQIIQKSVAYTAGYNMRYLLIYQTDAQLKERDIYGVEGAKVLRKNMGLSIIFPPKEIDDSVRELSETLGYKTVKTPTTSITTSSSGSSRNRGYRLDRRALLLPQEIIDLGIEKAPQTDVGLNQIILMENMKPFIAEKIIYFQEPMFMDRVKFSKDNIPSVPLLNF